MCSLFSGKTQDVHTEVFGVFLSVKTVQFLLSKEHVLHFTTDFYFCFSDTASGLLLLCLTALYFLHVYWGE